MECNGYSATFTFWLVTGGKRLQELCEYLRVFAQHLQLVMLLSRSVRIYAYTSLDIHFLVFASPATFYSLCWQALVLYVFTPFPLGWWLSMLNAKKWHLLYFSRACSIFLYLLTDKLCLFIWCEKCGKHQPNVFFLFCTQMHAIRPIRIAARKNPIAIPSPTKMIWCALSKYNEYRFVSPVFLFKMCFA